MEGDDMNTAYNNNTNNLLPNIRINYVNRLRNIKSMIGDNDFNNLPENFKEIYSRIIQQIQPINPQTNTLDLSLLEPSTILLTMNSLISLIFINLEILYIQLGNNKVNNLITELEQIRNELHRDIRNYYRLGREALTEVRPLTDGGFNSYYFEKKIRNMKNIKNRKNRRNSKNSKNNKNSKKRNSTKRN
jgi:hypothetical protein